MYIELHTHSWYSRGSILGEECTHSPIEIVRKAKEIGLNGIAVTDHNSLKSWFNLKKLKFNDFVVIPGEEISTNQGHILAIGISEEIKPKQHVLETIDKIHQQGGIAIAPHPFDIGKQGVGTFSRYADAIEVFNSMCLDRFSNLRAKRFAEKFNKSVTAGSDAHTKNMIGKSIVKLKDENFSLDYVLKEIKHGRVELIKKYQSIGEMTDWYLSRLTRNYASAINYIDSNYDYIRRYLLKKMLKLSNRDTLKAKATVTTLSYFSVVTSIVYSLFINGTRCLI